MVNLGDYIGHLLSEVTIARVKADLEAVRMAELYSSEPLLRNFPVPRVRFSNIEMSVPMRIADVKELMKDETVSKIDTPTLIRLSENIIAKELKSKNITLTQRENQVIKRRLKAKSDDIKNIRERGVSMDNISKNLSGEIFSSLTDLSSVKSKLTEKEITDLNRGIERKIKEELINLRHKPARIKILPLTNEVKEVEKPENLVIMKITLNEDALEISSIEDEEGKRDILVPE